MNKQSFPYFVDADLSKKEKEMRHFLMYDFNICLKSMLIRYGYNEFDKWFFNCCRQTAIAGTVLLGDKYFSEYDFKAYEADFADTLFGKPVRYQHCFIIASSKLIERHILIDMARTTNPLVFEPISDGHFYPNVDNYKDLKMLSCVEIPINEILQANITEYLTGLPTNIFIQELKDMIRTYQTTGSDSAKEKLLQEVYSLSFKKMEQFKKENGLLGDDSDGNRFITTE